MANKLDLGSSASAFKALIVGGLQTHHICWESYLALENSNVLLYFLYFLWFH